MKDEPSLTDEFLQMLENMTPIVAVTAGYRQQCLTQGFSTATAEQMAVAFHQFLLTQALQQMRAR